MSRLFKKLSSDGPILAVVMIGLTAIITHGLIIPRLGYYYDDWYMLWSGASRGAESMISLFSLDRPFMGVIYSYLYRILGDSIPGWHIFTLLIRIAGGMAFYWILNLAWPKLKSLFILAAMLFVVFPGFLAEPNAATKINHLIGYAAALFSIALTLKAEKTDRRGWKYACIALSMLLMAFYLWIYEYMIGLEVMRIALVYWMRWQAKHEKFVPAIKKGILDYIPYAFVILLFLVWRVFIFKSTRSATDLGGLVSDYQTNFVGMLLRLIFQVIRDFFSTTIFAWFVQPYHLFAKAEYGQMLTAFIITLVVVLIAIGYFFAVRKAEKSDSEESSPFILILIGGLIALGAVFPVVLSNRYLDLMNSYKGYALHPSAGAMIIVIGIVAMLKPGFRKIALIALLALSVATQSVNNQQWAKFWELERGFWWQLSWRAPDIRDNTLVMAYLPDGYLLQQDYEIWGPINLIYRARYEHFPLIQAEVLNLDTVLDVSKGKFIEPHVRDIYMPRDYRNFLLISQPSTQSCIHVIDGTMPLYSASERLVVEKVGAFSDIKRIQTSGTAPTPPLAIFGKEPEHGWCYYFQQADLSRQVGNWERIGELYDTATAARLKPADTSEYFVFIEGLVNLGRTGEAKAIANSVLKDNAALRYSLCKSSSAAPAYPAAYQYRQAEVNKIICKP